MDTWSNRKNEPKTNPNEPKRTQNEPKSCPPSVWRFKKAKMNVTTFITRNYEQLTTNYELIKTNPTCRGVASGEAGSNPISIGPLTPEIAFSIVCELVKIKRLGDISGSNYMTIASSNNWKAEGL